MADKQSDSLKKSTPNRKKRRNKSAKRKSERSFSSKRDEKLNLPTAEKDFPLREFSKDDKHGSNNIMFKTDLNEQDSGSSKDAPQMRVNKYHKHYSPNFNNNEEFPLSYRNRVDYRENLMNERGNYDTTLFTNRFNNNCFPPPNNFQFTFQETEFLNNEIDFLRQEHLRLTNALEDLKCNWNVQSNSEVDIIFKKRPLAEKFSATVNKLISSLLSGEIKVEELDKFCDEHRKSPEPLDECLFAVDSTADLSLNASVPVYDTSFDQILESAGDSINASPQKTACPGKRGCFNCNGDHHMSMCPYKLDFRKIANAKRQAKSSFVPAVRYHVHGKNENDFKPGTISNDLRDALGLEKDQIPVYVYRMRVLDYPPGWLYDAAVESSGMILYDSEGNALKEDNCEDGEVDTSGVRVQYDPDKLINYPGFNVPLPPDMIEEGEAFGLPSLQPHQLRNNVEKFMVKPVVHPSRKRKINLPNARPHKVQRLEEDMEIEADSDNDGLIEITNDFVPPLPDNAPPAPPPPPPPVDSGVISKDVISSFPENILDENSASFSDSVPSFSRIISCSELASGTSSPSLVELEELKKKLVLQLGSSIDDEAFSDPSSNPTLDDESSSNALIDDKTSESLYVLDECVASDFSNLSSLSSNSSQNKSDLSESFLNKELPENSEDKYDPFESPHSATRTPSQSKCVVLGTPSISSHSPYAKLPEYEKFSKDVSAHLPFENLPNATGTYEKMKNVLKRVKDKLNSIMN